MPVDIGLRSRVVELLTRVTGVWILGNSSSLLSYYMYNTIMQFRGRKFGNQHEIQYSSGHNRKLYSIDISYNTCTLGIDMSVCFSFCLSRHVE